MVTVFSTYHLNKALSVRDYLRAHNVDAEADRSGVTYLVLCSEEDVFKAKRLLAKIENRDDYAREVVGASWEQESNDRGASSGIGVNIVEYIKHAGLTGYILLGCALIFILQLVFDEGIFGPVFAALNFDGTAITTNFELWRIWTPAFMHGSWLHILFNLVMFNFLSMPVEQRLGRLRLVTIVIASGAVGNIWQYYASGGIGNFCGLSGVVYGLVGYMAVMSRRPDFAHGLRIIPGLFLFSLIFLGISFLFMSDVASYCHLGGLLAGLVVGFIDLRAFSKATA